MPNKSNSKRVKHGLQWFISRVGKEVYRKDTQNHSVTVSSAAHAKMLEMYQNDLDLYYSDKPFV